MINWDSAFGKNDIRGIYGKDVTEELFFFTSKAYIKYIMEQTGKQVQDLLNKIDAIDTIKLQEVLQQYTPDLIEKIYYPPFLGKKISILGDSISTFSGYIPSGNAAWYPRGEITSVKDTWWYQLIQQQEATLGINES